jgi:prophage maintenance system killer protein
VILHVDRGWLLDTAQQFLPADPDVTDFGTLAAAVARHADAVMDVPVYAEVHHRAAALMHQLVRVPALEFANEQFAAVVAASYLTASGVVVVAEAKQAVELALRIRDGQADVRQSAEAIRTWFR